MDNNFERKNIAIASFLYKNINFSTNQNLWTIRIKKKFYTLLWKLLIKTKILSDDPIINIKIGKKDILMPSSHRIPFLLQLLYYDTALSRISYFLKKKYDELVMIDIGANIGDTVSLITDVVNDGHYLCVEPEQKYFQVLKCNTKDIKYVTCEKSIISVLNDNSIIGKTLNEVGGTAYFSNNEVSLNEDQNNVSPSITTIDNLVKKYPKFYQTNLLKVDTDGYDIKVLESAASLFIEQKPIIYFEFSPWHLTNVGEDDPLSLFDKMSKIGYSQALFYDNFGYPLIYININESEILLNQLISYAKRKPNLYYDILMFPDFKKDDFDEFYWQEVKFFPDFKWY